MKKIESSQPRWERRDREGKGRGWFVSKSLTGMRGGKMRKTRFGLSVWPSVDLRFSWRYKTVCLCSEREGGQKEKRGFFKS